MLLLSSLVLFQSFSFYGEKKNGKKKKTKKIEKTNRAPFIEFDEGLSKVGHPK